MVALTLLGNYAVLNCGDLIKSLKGAGRHYPWVAEACVFVNWVMLREATSVITTKREDTIIHFEGITADELGTAISDCKSVMVTEVRTQNESQQPSDSTPTRS